jgi:hypothetical protein
MTNDLFIHSFGPHGIMVILNVQNGQNNGNPKKLRNGICVGYIECSSVLFTCIVRVSALVTVLSDSLCQRIGKWDTCPNFKEDRSLM